jgi:hypothetical protein
MSSEVWVSQTPPPLSVGEIASDWPHQVIVKALPLHRQALL